MNKNLYFKTASCAEPPRLLNKLWGDIKPDDFACQPVIQYPAQSSSFQLDDDELMTIGCKIYGEPMPSVQWVFNNRPISNYSHGDYKFTVYESVDNTMAKWINLTVSRSRLIGKSEFKCIAQNPAGLEERKITVIVQVPIRSTPLPSPSQSLLRHYSNVATTLHRFYFFHKTKKMQHNMCPMKFKC